MSTKKTIEKIKEVKDTEVAESYEDMVDKWGGKIIWDKAFTYNEILESDVKEEKGISQTWTLCETDRNFILMHSTPSPKPSKNPEQTKEKYRTPSIDVKENKENFQKFVYEVIEIVYKRDDPPTPKENINRTISPEASENKSEYLKNLMNDIYQENI